MIATVGERNPAPRINDAMLAYRVVDGQAVIVDLSNRTLNVMNSTATEIWRLLQEGAPIRSIVSCISHEFDVSLKEAAQDTDDFLRQVSSAGWVLDHPAEITKSPTPPQSDGSVFEKLRELTTVKMIPLVAHIDLTYRCPLKCAHCYLRSTDSRSECSTEEVEAILDQLSIAGCLESVPSLVEN
jgi:hypothetical protein